MSVKCDIDLVIANPVGYNLNKEITNGIKIYNNQEQAFKNADFIYAKNWSSYDKYGKILNKDNSKWIIDKSKMNLTKNAKFN